VGDDRPRRLGAVPGTVAPQSLGQLLKVDERPLEAVPAAHGAYSVSVPVSAGAGPVSPPPVSAPPVVVSAGGGSKPGA
jgi:hypothetical protein